MHSLAITPVTTEATMQGHNGYICFYRGKRHEVWANTSFQAHSIAVQFYKARKPHEVHVHLAQRSDGTEVTHSTASI